MNSKGFNTSAAFGFTTTLLDLIKREQPTHIAVVFDTAAPTERHELLLDYKANVTAVKEHIEKHNGQAPPGVNYSEFRDVGVRRDRVARRVRLRGGVLTAARRRRPPEQKRRPRGHPGDRGASRVTTLHHGVMRPTPRRPSRPTRGTNPCEHSRCS